MLRFTVLLHRLACRNVTALLIVAALSTAVPKLIAETDPPAAGDAPASGEWTFEQETQRVDRTFPADRVRVEIVQAVAAPRTWDFTMLGPQFLFETDYFAMKNLPRAYDAAGLIAERDVPMLLHLSSRVELPAGEYEFLLRSLDAARLYVDGKLVGETGFMKLQTDAHQPYYDGLDRGPDLLSLAEGHKEARLTVTLEGSTHSVSLYRLLGNKKHGSYLGEMAVAVAPAGEEFRILAPAKHLPFTDAGWLDFLDWEHAHLTQVDRERRRRLADSQTEYWSRRHEAAREIAAAPPSIPETFDSSLVNNPIDRFINARLEAADVPPQPLVDDLAFLRRVTLDVVGTIPTEQQIAAHLSLSVAERRSKTIDRLLDDPGWADHWVGYWQDVLAENPGLTKPQLNNTGPFRWFLHEAFLDNKPFDRFVTELILMEGSGYTGGPAGFGIASQNDVPLAAKAHILGTAFLGVEMKCARCHDAPYHDVTQGDLFSLAAMLRREPLTVPQSSSVPASTDEASESNVRVSLQPGEAVSPAWPFAEFLAHQDLADDASAVSEFADEFLNDPADSRERLALLITAPTNDRFAPVIVNRLWKRYLGRGLIEPVDDWEQAECSHPELLDYLAHELVVHDYDLKHVARLILNSQTYQRTPLGDAGETTADGGDPSLFAGTGRRRMTAEQIVDSLLLAIGKEMGCEELTMDRDGRRPDNTFGHLGVPRRAWELAAVSNERDRPSLNLPAAQSVIDLLAAYGWRQQRQEPLTDREDALTPLQPMALAHGTAANRIVDLSDHAAATALCLEDQPVERLVQRLFQRLLTRPPTDEEQELFTAVLREGYDARIVAGPEAVPPRRIYRSGITWSSHFDPRSDDEAIRRQREVLQGDAPSARLDPDWRERAEDVLWTLVNAPEFVFTP